MPERTVRPVAKEEISYALAAVKSTHCRAHRHEVAGRIRTYRHSAAISARSKPQHLNLAVVQRDSVDAKHHLVCAERRYRRIHHLPAITSLCLGQCEPVCAC